MWTLELLPDEDGEAMPPPSNTQAGDSQQSRARAAAASKGPWLLTAGEFYVGRKARTCQIIINNNRVSRQHARITVGGVVVTWSRLLRGLDLFIRPMR